MKKLFLSILVLGLLLGGNGYAEKIEVFKCKPKKIADPAKVEKYLPDERKIDSRKNLDFSFMHTLDRNYKFIKSDFRNNYTLVEVLNKSILKQYKHYKSMHIWFTYEFDDFFSETFTVSQYIMTENKKNGNIVLAASIVDTSEYYFNEFSKLDESKNMSLKNEDELIKVSIDISTKINDYFNKRWAISSSTYNLKQAGTAWDCLKQ